MNSLIGLLIAVGIFAVEVYWLWVLWSNPPGWRPTAFLRWFILSALWAAFWSAWHHNWVSYVASSIPPLILWRAYRIALRREAVQARDRHEVI